MVVDWNISLFKGVKGSAGLEYNKTGVEYYLFRICGLIEPIKRDAGITRDKSYLRVASTGFLSNPEILVFNLKNLNRVVV